MKRTEEGSDATLRRLLRDIAAGTDSKQDTTLRLIRALVAGCKAEPALNAWLATSGSVLLFAWAITETGTPFFGIGLAVIGSLGLAFAARRWPRFDGLINETQPTLDPGGGD